jgi:hypothetical protein
MNLAETLLEKLSEWRPAGEDRPSASFSLPEHGWTVRLDAERVDTVGCVLNEIEAVRDVAVADDAKAIEAHARQVAGRVTGLLESLRLVEVDRARNIALLRSDEPKAKGDDVRYYEVRFQGLNRVSVQRFTASKHSPARREAMTFALTHEVVAHLVEDLVRE